MIGHDLKSAVVEPLITETNDVSVAPEVFVEKTNSALLGHALAGELEKALAAKMQEVQLVLI